MKPVFVTHVTTSISRLGGGLFESVRHLSQETEKNDIKIEVLALHDFYSDEDAVRWTPLKLQTFPVFGPRAFAYSPDFFLYMEKSQPDMVHLHGIWQYPTSAVLRWARQTGKPYMVSVHGMLEPWALQRSRFKKALVNWFYQNTCLREATCLRATAEAEVETMRQLGLKNPIALIANGVPTPISIPAGRPANFRAKKRALFLSRIHPKKGLLDLVRAWSALNPADWELVIVGPDERGHLAEVLACIKENQMEAHIQYGGEFWEENAKLNCYFDADLFVLPSYSENFGLAIAEALGCGLPVITTHPTPWQDLETYRCGWWIETGEKSLTQALKTAMAVPLEELQEMGLRGRKLIQAKYAWPPIGKQMAQVYEWLAGRYLQPDFVRN